MIESNRYVTPQGNQLWQLRTKHGRDRIFETPEILWSAACEYFQWAVDNPLPEADYRGKDATLVILNKLRAFSMHGLCIYLGINTKYFYQFQLNIEGRDDDLSRDFSNIITRIIETIYEQKFTGAAAGLLNPNIIAREIGLAEKTENKNVTIDLTDYIDYSSLSEEALKEITDAGKNKRLEGHS